MQGLGTGMAGPARLPTGFLCSIYTTFQGEGAFTEMCIQGILLIEKTQESSKCSVVVKYGNFSLRWVKDTEGLSYYF